MTTEMYAALIGAVVLFLTNMAGLAKGWTEIARIKRDRMSTKQVRDQDSQEWHDRLLKAEFNITRLNDAQSLTATTLDDLRDTCAALNMAVAKLDVSSANLAEAVKELKAQK